MKGNKVEIPNDSPEVGAIYKHYKGDLYKVYCLALHSDHDTYMVIYEPMYDNADAKYFTLPLTDWNMKKVNAEGVEMDRFTKQ